LAIFSYLLYNNPLAIASKIWGYGQKMKAAFYTLGCKTNQFESQAMEKLLLAKGYEIVPFDEEADVYIINSCTVTATGDKKTRQTMRRIAALRPDALVAVCGCYAELSPQELEAILPGRIVVGGNKDHVAFINKLHERLTGHAQNEPVEENKPSPKGKHTFEKLPAGGISGRTRALLKVQDGCCHYCSYCIIPYARGTIRSLSIGDAISQAQALAAEGYREIVLTGIEISSYGKERPGGETLLTLTRSLCRAVPSVRFRLGSLWPLTVDTEFCRLLSKEKNLCPHFHLSVQSGSDGTLARMNRPYGVAELKAAIANLRKYFPHAAITADLICGFPGETEEEFAETLAFLKEAVFSQMHIFPYSPRPGTKAAKMDGQHTRETKEARCKAAAAIAKENKIAYLEAQKGRKLEVLFEEPLPSGRQGGHSENYLMVEVESHRPLQGELHTVEIIGRQGQNLMGRLCSPDM
jgi:threonylcarbamoyladenosine tRNA methylthiotransferase MtaB